MLERLNKNQFKLQLRGREEDNEHVRLSDFVKELNSIKEVLVDIDKKISGTKNPTTDYKITDLSHSSPSTIAIEAIPLESNIDNSNEIVGSFFYGFQKIQKGTAPDNFDSLILEKYKKIAGGFKRKISEVVLYYEDSSFQIGRDFERQILEIIGEDEIFDGFVEGALEMINFHKGLNKFNIYPFPKGGKNGYRKVASRVTCVQTGIRIRNTNP